MTQDVKRPGPTLGQPVQDRAAGPSAYQPPRLTEKRALAEVTLFSGACTPGAPGCTIGHP